MKTVIQHHIISSKNMSVNKYGQVVCVCNTHNISFVRMEDPYHFFLLHTIIIVMMFFFSLLFHCSSIENKTQSCLIYITIDTHRIPFISSNNSQYVKVYRNINGLLSSRCSFSQLKVQIDMCVYGVDGWYITNIFII